MLKCPCCKREFGPGKQFHMGKPVKLSDRIPWHAIPPVGKWDPNRELIQCPGVGKPTLTAKEI